MPYDEVQVRRALRDGTDPATKPTSRHVDEIASLTYNSDAIDIMKRMLQRRIDPRAYVTNETENTLLMLRSCICTASEEFIAYVKSDLTPLVTQFYSKGSAGELRGLHEAAGSLLSILRDDASLSRERRLHLAIKADRVQEHDRRDKGFHAALPSASTAETVPMTPPATPGPGEPRARKLSHNTAHPAPVASTPTSSAVTKSYGGLPTPISTPGEEWSQLEPVAVVGSITRTDDIRHAQIEEKVRFLTSNTPPAITTKQMEEVVDMTFNKSELNVVWNVIDMRLEALKLQQTYYHLIKTLTLIHHCLFYASDDFLEYCRRRQDTIEKLRAFRCSNSDVHSRAEAILDRFKDETRLRRERRSRKIMGKRQQAPDQSNLIRPLDTTVSPPLSPVTRRHSLQDIGAVVEKMGQYPVGFGGYSDVWKGKLTMDHGATSTLVAIKVLRLGASSGADPDRLHKRLEREVRVWQLLQHESIADFHGVVYHYDKKPAIISPWYANGSADAYLQQNPRANPMKILWEIVLGIAYLHDKGIVHGDLKGGNVMVDETGHAKLIDFGLSRLIDSVAGASGLTTSTVAFSIRWCAPELVKSEDCETTKATDIYAFASTALQLLSGDVPYNTLKERAVLVSVIQGVRPRKLSSGLRYNFRGVDQLWSLLESCWAEAPLRPSTSEVKERMRLLYR